jgi:beta-mannosidase
MQNRFRLRSTYRARHAGFSSLNVIAHPGRFRSKSTLKQVAFWLALACSMFGGPNQLFAQPLTTDATKIPLTSEWQFRQDSSGTNGNWLRANVPGDVHLDLLRNGLIPDPFYRDNEAKLQWIGKANWSYRTTIHADPVLLHWSHLDLVFDGLDTTASVYLNDHLILSANNMFRKWRINIKPYLRPGANELRVEFLNSFEAAAKLAAANPNQPEIQVPVKSYLRKAAYEYGWDWGPRFVTYGIWRPVFIQAWDEARIADVYISEPDVTAQAAHLIAQTTVVSSSETPAEIALSYHLNPDGKQVEVTCSVMLHVGRNTIAIPIDIPDPARWYPAGYGAQSLYTFHIVLATKSAVQDEKTVVTGLKSVVLRRRRDRWGRSFEFVVNGIPIFVKGADVIPFDSFPERVTEADYRRILESARDANMNMIRLWGGGYYETDKFYQLCDQLGLMVWQDFMFASSWYPGTHDWKHNVQIEVEQQVARLRNHPSMTLWSGNNEVESVLYAFLGGESSKARLQIWKNYLTVFSGIIPSVVQREDPEVPYWPSSPSSNYEKTSDIFQAGDAHDWSVWHGREPFSAYDHHFYRFTSEYGFQSFPELRTVQSFTKPSDRTSIFTPVMLAHQKNNEGNEIIHEYILRDYPEPKDFKSFLYVSQVLQAEGVKVGAEHMRRNRPRIMGSLFWQLNDCWPVASWSSIDYYGRWKALQYYARRFYNPLLVSPTLRDGKVFVYAVSDRQAPVAATLRFRVIDMHGAMIEDDQKQITLPPLSSDVYLTVPLESIVQKHVDLSDIFVATDLTVNGKTGSRNLLYLEPTKQVHLLPANIHTKLVQDGDQYKLTLFSDVLARDVYVTLGNLDARVSDNYFDLLPEEPVTITISGKASLPALKKQMQMMSLVEAFPAKSE